MGRLHLFEFEDLKWLPKIFRRFITDLLAYQMDRFGIYHAAHEKIEEVSLGLRRNINLVLTDKYPNVEAFETLRQSYVQPITASVDAAKVLPHLKGFRTMFTAFHHFKPEQARNILQDAVHANMPIGIFEITERKAASFMTLLDIYYSCYSFDVYMGWDDLQFKNIYQTRMVRDDKTARGG